IGPFAIDSRAAVAKRIFTTYLAGGTKRFRQRPHELVIKPEEQEALHQLCDQMAGPEPGARFEEAVLTRNLEALEKLTPEMRPAVRRKGFDQAPRRAISRSAWLVVRRLIAPCFPVAPLLVLKVRPEERE